MPIPRRLASMAGGILLGAACSACGGLPERVAPPVLPSAQTLGLQQAGLAQLPATRWWRELGDPQLTSLIDASIDGNPDLALARARARQAMSVAGIAEAGRSPTVGMALDMQHLRTTKYGFYPPPYAGAVLTQRDVGLQMNWELDLWGERRAQWQSALAQAKASELETEAVRSALASAVASAYFSYQESLVRGNLLREIEAVSAKLAKLHLAMQQVGLQNAERSSAALQDDALARQQLAQAEHATIRSHQQLAALLGRTPAQLPQLSAAGHWHEPTLPQSIPAELLGRRADLQAWQMRLRGRQSAIEAARARFFPNINLAAVAGYSSLLAGKLFDNGARTWNVGPALSLPLFEGGALQANLRTEQANQVLTVAHYHAALLDAVHEVAERLAQLASLQRERAEGQEALEHMCDNQQLAEARWRRGLTDQLPALTWRVRTLRQELAQTALDFQVWHARAALIKALGGGFEAAAEPSASPFPFNSTEALQDAPAH